jgi:hypothetical protein
VELASFLGGFRAKLTNAGVQGFPKLAGDLLQFMGITDNDKALAEVLEYLIFNPEFHNKARKNDTILTPFCPCCSTHLKTIADNLTNRINHGPLAPHDYPLV